MMLSELWDFVREHGLEGWDIGTLIFGLLLLAWAVLQARASIHTKRSELTYGDIVVPIGLFGMAALCFFVVWIFTRERLLLQPGAGRYTVAR